MTSGTRKRSPNENEVKEDLRKDLYVNGGGVRWAG